MEPTAKAFLLVLLGMFLLAANAWYVGVVYRSIKGGNLVIGPIRIIGGPSDASGMDEVLARMLLVRLRSIIVDLEQSQSSLQNPAETAEIAGHTGALSTFFGAPRTVQLDAQLFEPAKIDVKVAGVEVGGLLPWFQRWFVEDRTLSFTVSLQDRAAVVAGNIDPLDPLRHRPIWIRIDNQSAEAIVDGIAFALIQRAWAKDGLEIGELTPEEFRTIVLSIGKVSEINRRVRTFKLPARAEYSAILNDVAPLAERITNWNQLTYFAATIAEGAEDNRRALVMYRRLKETGKSPIAEEVLDEKLKALVAARENSGELSLGEYRRQAAIAVDELSKLFGFSMSPPPIELESADFRNAYWDGNKIHIPPGIEDIPDVIVHETTIPFIQKLRDFRWEGQTGALVNSYTDVLTSIVKQASLRQTAEQADWTIAPGGIAWITGKIRDSRDQRPLRSLRAPGTAYSDSQVGKDPQVAHYRDLVTTAEDNGGIHTNSGIPNKAFYEAAMKIGTDKAGRIWVEALKRFESNVNLPQASRILQATAARLYGDHSAETAAVREAWRAVGL
jgi:hypothetical protein